jgi:ABC-type transporter Mla subunit MlaD
MEKENKNNFLDSLEKDLKEDLNNLAIENKKNQEKYQNEITELVKKQLTEAEKKFDPFPKLFKSNKALDARMNKTSRTLHI